MTRLCLSFYCTLFSIIALAQSDYEISRLVNIKATKAPEASAIQRYSDIPVNYSTGVPNISFPIYNVLSGNLNVPITLSYHAGGIKVSDVATCVGLGFNLSCGGRINRVVIDKEDLGQYDPLYFKTPTEYNNARDYLYQHDAANAFDLKFEFLYDKLTHDKIHCDRISDRYSLFLPNGTSVVFRKNFITGQFIQTPYEGLKIEYNSTTAAFKIIDKDGTIYNFSDIDDAGWNLTKIENVDKTNFVDFVYGAQQINSTASYPSFTEESGEWIDAWPTTANDPESCSNFSGSLGVHKRFENASVQQNFGQHNNLVTKIRNNNIEVQFTYEGGQRHDPGSTILKHIIVVDKFTGNQIKKVIFNFSNFGTLADKTWRLKLNSFSMVGSDNASNIETYGFGYNEISTLPPYYNPNTHNQFHEDFWGYYNGSSGITRLPIEMGVLTGTSRNPDPELAKACSLKEVFYPTGGKTEYELEGNFGMQYQLPFAGSQGQLGFGPGLRVKTIKNYSDAGVLANCKTYTYSGGSNTSIGSHLFSYDKTVVFSIDPTEWEAYAKTRRIIMSEPLESYSTGDNPPMLYGEVKEYNGTTSENTGYMTYQYSLPVRQEVNPVELNINQRHAWQWDYGPESPLLNGILTYKKDNLSATGYTLVRQEINEYASLKYNKYVTGINIVENTTYRQARQGGYLSYFTYIDGQNQPATNGVACKSTFNPSQWGPGQNIFFSSDNILATETLGYSSSNLLSKKTELVLSVNGYLSTEVSYQYEPNTLLLKEQTTKNSKKEIFNIEFNYPSDFISVEPYTSMVNQRNCFAPVVETKLFKDLQLLKSTKTNYGFWNSNTHIFPISIESKIGNYASEIRARYHFYDLKGNVVSVSKENDIKQSFVWGYNKLYPVASVVNAASLDIAYTSFEEIYGGGPPDLGGWEYTGEISAYGNRVVPNVSMTGKNGYGFADEGYSNLRKSGLSPAKTYTVSFWAWGNNYMPYISGSLGYQVVTTTSFLRRGWYYYQLEITGTSFIDVGRPVEDPVIIDELRLCPAGSQMTTFTYDPVVGMTSQTDPNGKTTYYEYDSFNRLKYVKDQNQNVVKVMDYKYRMPLIGYGNTGITQTLYSQNCGTGTPLPYSYNVPANKYRAESSQAEVDALAQNEINTVGQNQANSNGQCQQIVYARISYENVWGGFDYSYGDVFVRFYQDAGCTIPLTVSSLALNYLSQDGCYSATSYNEQTQTVTGSFFKLAENVPLMYREEIYDYGNPTGYFQTCYIDYTLRNGTGYIIAY